MSTPASDPELLLEHSEFVRKLLRKLVFDSHEAEDLLQETLLAAMRKPPAPGRPPRAWLARVARNLAMQMARRRGFGQRAEREAAREEPMPAVSDVVELHVVRSAVVSAVVHVREPYRTALLLRFYEDLPPRAVARRLGVPVETARTRIKRGLALVRRDLEPRAGSGGKAWALALIALAFPDGVSGAAAKAGAAKSASSALRSKLVVAACVAGALVVSARLFVWPSSEAHSSAPAELALPSGLSLASPEDEPALVARLDPSTSREAIAPGESVASSALAATIALEGFALDARGAPVAGARIAAWAGASPTSPRGASMPPLAEARADERGRFRLEGLPPDCFVHASFDGLLALEGARVRARAGETLTGIELRLAPPRAIHGRVLDVRGKPIANAQIQALRGPSLALVRPAEQRGVSYWSQIDRPVRTDADGAFAFAEMPATSVRLHVSSDEHASTYAHATVGCEALEVVLEDWRALDVRVLGAQGESVEGAEVALETARDPRRSAISDELGRSRFERVAPQRALFVRASAPGLGAAVSGPLRVGEREVEIRLPGTRRLAGRVVDRSGRDAGGARIEARLLVPVDPGTSITVEEARVLERMRSLAELETSADGTFAFDALPLAEIELAVTARERSAPVQFQRVSALATEVELRLGNAEPRVPHVTGRALADGAADEPRDPIRVTAFATRGAFERIDARVDEEGRYELFLPFAGSWTFVFEQAGCASRTLALELAATATELPDVRLRAERQLELRIIDARGDALRGGLLLVADERGVALPVRLDEESESSAVRIGPTGRVLLSGLPAESVVLTVLPPGLRTPESRRFSPDESGLATWKLETDLSNPTRLFDFALLGEAGRAFEGRYDARIVDGDGRALLSWSGSVAPGGHRIDPERAALLLARDRKGVCSNARAQVLAEEWWYASERLAGADDDQPQLRLPIPDGAREIIVSADGFETVHALLPASGGTSGGNAAALSLTLKRSGS